jgi:hypothetical protein
VFGVSGEKLDPVQLELLWDAHTANKQHAVDPAGAKDKPWIKRMGSHAHMRRMIFETSEQSPHLVTWIQRQIAHLYQIEENLRQTKAVPNLRLATLAAQSRLIHRRLHMVITLLAKRHILL